MCAHAFCVLSNRLSNESDSSKFRKTIPTTPKSYAHRIDDHSGEVFITWSIPSSFDRSKAIRSALECALFNLAAHITISSTAAADNCQSSMAATNRIIELYTLSLFTASLIICSMNDMGSRGQGLKCVDWHRFSCARKAEAITLNPCLLSVVAERRKWLRVSSTIVLFPSTISHIHTSQLYATPKFWVTWATSLFEADDSDAIKPWVMDKFPSMIPSGRWISVLSRVRKYSRYPARLLRTTEMRRNEKIEGSGWTWDFICSLDCFSCDVFEAWSNYWIAASITASPNDRFVIRSSIASNRL